MPRDDTVVLRKLSFFNNVINRLLKLRHPTSILKEKYGQIENLLFDLSDSKKADLWSDKVAQLCEQIAVLELQSVVRQSSLSTSTVSGTSSNFEVLDDQRNEYDQKCCEDSILDRFFDDTQDTNTSSVVSISKVTSTCTAALTKDNNNDLLDCPPLITFIETSSSPSHGNFSLSNPNLNDKQSTNLHNSCLKNAKSTQEVFNELKKQFSSLSVVKSESDTEELMSLAELLGKSNNLAKSFKNAFFRDELVVSALDKLPQDMREEFLVKAPQGTKNYSLYYLKLFVLEQIRVYYFESNRRRQSNDWCIYCKWTNGHGSEPCPKLNKMRCFCCMQFGHSSRRCLPELIRNKILSKMRNQMIDFDCESDDTIGRLKKLFCILTKFAEFISPYGGDHGLRTEALNYLLSKLPTNLKEQFEEQKDRPASRELSDLKTIILAHIQILSNE